MKRKINQLAFGALIALAAGFPCCTGNQLAQGSSDLPTNNTLTPEELSGGWQLLFDGTSDKGWRPYGHDGPSGWLIENGELITPGVNKDIISTDQFENFELNLEWKIEKGGNSGILFNVVEDTARYSAVYHTGPEYQLIDDVGFESPLEDWQLTGANYAMQAPSKKVAKPAGEYNTSRIVVNNGHVEHWLNGEKVVDYQMWTPEWDTLVTTGKWKDFPGYGRAKKGHLALQDHGHKTWFRNIKVKVIQ